ncbi:MAG: UDP-N-acetylglucosamine--N-acetylmuramyl-(pentapeptide) pyrophosphoryl-undecaprenol N-acetylglucosamine transferase [Elusimicrobiota bacterium]|nr:UDP-N-acetylglucosamine--N-acetylmuramyl-(pentapeptide) pyrophosphoryl-undecaprenol N-acetylglucosamine transferase [Elusimicrobiota bacterium]
MFTGASGGHIIPALALRRHFPDAVIVAVKTEAALEILKDAENVLFIRPLAVKKITLGALKDAARIIVFAWKFKSRRILCFGSYLNVPGVFCAKLTGARLYFFEPNAVPGKGTALLKIFADKIFEIFSGTIKDSAKTVLCKFPVDARKYGKEEARAKLGFDSEKPLILILGGSQGSAFINDLVLRMLSKLRFAQIIHITGPADFNRVNSAYGAHRGNHLVLPVCHYMSLLYSVADAAVSRAGAGTLAELSFYKIPSLLIPYPLAGAHQKKNAEFFSARNSALMISQRNAKEDNVFEALKNMLSGNFWKLSENLAKISVSDDGSDLAEQISAE